MTKIDSILQKLAILSISLMLASNNAISGALVYIQEAFDLTRSSTEFIVSLSSLTTIIFIFLAEYIALLIGMKKTVLLGLSLVSVSGLIPVFFKTYPAILLSRIILGSGLGLFNGHSANYINLLYKDDGERTKLHALRNATESIGQILMYTLAGILIRINFIYTFLVYFIAIFIFIFFKIEVRDVDLNEEHSKLRLDSNIVLFIFFAMLMILNVIAMTNRFPFVASLASGLDVNVSFYLNLIPVVGMLSSILFTPINRKIRENTILLGIGLYIFANFLIMRFDQSLWGFLLCILLVTFAQSLCMPYIFAEVPRYVKGHSSRFATNLIFIGCNLGTFFAPLFMKAVDGILKTNSLSNSFIAFVFIYLILFIIFVRRNRYKKRSGF